MGLRLYYSFLDQDGKEREGPCQWEGRKMRQVGGVSGKKKQARPVARIWRLLHMGGSDLGEPSRGGAFSTPRGETGASNSIIFGQQESHNGGRGDLFIVESSQKRRTQVGASCQKGGMISDRRGRGNVMPRMIKRPCGTGGRKNALSWEKASRDHRLSKGSL